MKNAQLRRTLQKLVKIQNARQGSFPCKIQGFSAESESIDSSLQAVNIRARVNDDFSFPGLFGTGTFSQVAGVLIKHNKADQNLKWRREILFCGHAVLGQRHTGEFCHIR